MKRNQYTGILLITILLGISNMSSLFAQDQRINYPNGSFYVGQVVDGKPNGKGKLTFSDPSGELARKTYEGDFVEGKMTGKGKLTYASGDIYEGEFFGDKLNGWGIKTYINGDVFKGEFKNDNRNGVGKFTFHDGAFYDGEWKNHKKNGKGILSTKYGTYEGDFVDDNMDGIGTFKYANGSKYEGHWKDNLQNGKGKYTISDGSIYVGDFVDDKMCGKGKLTNSDGSFYEGDFKDNYGNGNGKYVAPSGQIYIGEFKFGKANGKGKEISSDGKVYEGDWVNGESIETKVAANNRQSQNTSSKNSTSGSPQESVDDYSFLGKIKKQLTSEENTFLRKVLDSYDEDPSGKIGVNCGIGTATCKWCGRNFRYQKVYQSRVAVLKQFENPLVNAFEGIYVAFGVPMAKAAGVDVIGQMATEVKQSLREIKNGNIYECGGTVPDFCSQKCEYESKHR